MSRIVPVLKKWRLTTRRTCARLCHLAVVSWIKFNFCSAMAGRVIWPWRARAHRYGTGYGEAHPNLGRPQRIGGAGTLRAALRQCRWVQRPCECELEGSSAGQAGESVPLYVEASTGCRAFGASGLRPTRVSDENTLARRHDARHPERQ